MIACLKLCLLGLLFSAFPAWAWAPKSLVIFGDSLSDTGNKFKQYHQPVSPPYWNGRYSNGPLWIEDLAYQSQLIDNPMTNPDEAVTSRWKNYAFGDSTVLKGHVGPGVQTRTLNEEVNEFITQAPTLDWNTTLVVLWDGSNDLMDSVCLKDPFQCTRTVVQETIRNIDLLHEKGARYFLLPLMPDVSLTPLAHQALPPHQRKELQQLVKYFNNEYEISLEHLQASTPNLHLFVVDTNLFIQQNKDKFPMSLSSLCYNNEGKYDKIMGSVCENPDDYFFWDQMHPTAKAHQQFAEAVAESLLHADGKETSNLIENLVPAITQEPVAPVPDKGDEHANKQWLQ
ncbi:MAG TPA: SGNH/GDSL hydrolase family protein [Coxiellaceae bacterium]|nr:SGNH/GDSL hydrolase family protein [Coxiellaceae bacterium]